MNVFKKTAISFCLAFAAAFAADAGQNFENEFASWYYSVLDTPNRDAQIRMVRRQYSLMTEPPAPGQPDLYEEFVALCEKYMYDPNSPYRDEDLWCVVASLRIDDPLTPKNLKPKYQQDVRLCSLNPVGSVATNFRYQDAKGRMHCLYDTKSRYTILMFSNPGCNACKEIITTICSEKQVDARIRAGEISVVNVYIDEDLDAWRSYAKEYPTYWSNGFDPNHSLKDDCVYHIRAIPSLYLLRADKTVIFKDVDTGVLMNFLINN